MSYFDDLLKDRNNPFEINLELKIRKLIENKTDYQFEIHRNDNQYEYDLEIFYYKLLNNGRFEKYNIAFIEIEISEHWVNEYPKYWKKYSFCKRKIFEFDKENYKFTNNLKKNAVKTIYIIFNKSLTDCIAQNILYISKNFDSEYEKLCEKEDKNWFMRTNKNNIERVIKGIDNFFIHLNKYLKRKVEKLENLA